MAEIKFSQLTTAAQLTNDDIFALAQMQGGSLSSVKTSMIAVANYLNTQVQYTTAYNTQAKTTAGAINELKQLISLIPQFSIEVVEELPTEDISDTTIYLVPAEDPEVGNYYEEYIHVNDAWELVGTTAVDLSAYYTKLEVDGLLATKASVTEVALKENKSDMPTDVRTIIKDCKTPKNATITNGIAQFECIEENLVKGLKVTMNPIQDLHGYPNPWAGGAGKNEYPLNSAPLTTTELTITPQTNGKFRIQANTTAQRSISISTPTENLTLLPIGNHTISVDRQLPNGISLQLSGSNNNGMSYGIIQNTTTYITREVTDATKGFYYLTFVVPANVTADFEVGLQIEKGNSATTFAPYSNICPISGRTEVSVTRTAGEDVETKTHQYSETIYGGVDDFVNGGATSNMGMVNLGTLNWYRNTTYNVYYAQIAGKKEGRLNIISEQYKVVDKAFQYLENGEMAGVTGAQQTDYINVKDDRYSDTTDFKNAVNGSIVVYELATPTTIETSAEEITTVAGTNIISGTEPISECKYTELATVDDLIKIIGGQ